MQSLKNLILLRCFLTTIVLLLSLSCLFAKDRKEVWLEYHEVTAEFELKETLGTSTEDENTTLKILKIGMSRFNSSSDVFYYGISGGLNRLEGKYESTTITAIGPVVGFDIVLGKLTEFTVKAEYSHFPELIITGTIGTDEMYTRTDGSILSIGAFIGWGTINRGESYKIYVGLIQETIDIGVDKKDDITSFTVGLGSRF